MVLQPVLETTRLVLRPFHPADAADVQRLAGDARIAEGTVAVPHPYPDGAAEAWIAGHAAAAAERREIALAITDRTSGRLFGAASLVNISPVHQRAEVGYWVGVEFWGRGYCTEAIERLIRFAGEELGVTKVVGRCFGWNEASASVMVKAGLRLEGRLFKHELRNGQFVDQLLFGRILPGRDGS